MAPCCTNVVTPKMIKKGQIKIGDRIQLEDVLAEAPVISTDIPPKSSQQPSSSAQSTAPAATIKGNVKEGEDVLVQSASVDAPVSSSLSPSQSAPDSAQEASQPKAQAAAAAMEAQPYLQGNLPNSMSRNSANNISHANNFTLPPIGKEDMTSYMDQVSFTEINGTPMITVPQTPMTPQAYDETIDVTSVQAYVGFLRTQMGRYMRIEQLIGSNVIEDRYGFLVGVGTNFILLQEITSGNLMVIDLFSIRLTYIYYSDPVLPNITR